MCALPLISLSTQQCVGDGSPRLCREPGCFDWSFCGEGTQSGALFLHQEPVTLGFPDGDLPLRHRLLRRLLQGGVHKA